MRDNVVTVVANRTAGNRAAGRGVGLPEVVVGHEILEAGQGAVIPTATTGVEASAVSHALVSREPVEGARILQDAGGTCREVQEIVVGLTTYTPPL